LRGLLEKCADADLLREMIGYADRIRRIVDRSLRRFAKAKETT
jgi:hypothetical protein